MHDKCNDVQPTLSVILQKVVLATSKNSSAPAATAKHCWTLFNRGDVLSCASVSITCVQPGCVYVWQCI